MLLRVLPSFGGGGGWCSRANGRLSCFCQRCLFCLCRRLSTKAQAEEVLEAHMLLRQRRPLVEAEVVQPAPAFLLLPTLPFFLSSQEASTKAGGGGPGGNTLLRQRRLFGGEGSAAKAPGFPASANAAFSVFAGGFDKGAEAEEVLEATHMLLRQRRLFGGGGGGAAKAPGFPACQRRLFCLRRRL